MPKPLFFGANCKQIIRENRPMPQLSPNSHRIIKVLKRECTHQKRLGVWVDIPSVSHEAFLHHAGLENAIAPLIQEGFVEQGVGLAGLMVRLTGKANEVQEIV